MRLVISLISMLFFTTGCVEHYGHDIVSYKGDFRYDGDIGEFFDCKSRKKYFIAKAGINEQLKKTYDELKLKDKDDAYVHVEGYIKSEPMIEGIGPTNVFVVTELNKIDTKRGCTLSQ